MPGEQVQKFLLEDFGVRLSKERWLWESEKAEGVTEIGRIYTSQREAFGPSAPSGFGASHRQRRGGGDVQAPGGGAV